MNWQELMEVEQARRALEAHHTPDYSQGYVPFVEPPRIVAAVLDDGCDVEHPQLTNVISQSINFERPSHSLLTSNSSHGTLSAGLVAGEANGTFLGGVARKSETLNTALIVAKYNPDSDNDEAMLRELCEQGARVISCSWGYGPGYFSNKSATAKADRLRRLVKELSEEHNTLFVFAAGNEGKPLVYKDFSFADYGIVVAATLNRENHPEIRSTSCNYGAGITLCAPGSDSTGLCLVSTSNREHGNARATGSTHLDFHANTSAACPMVAGVAALVMAANPDLSARQVKTVLCGTADRIDLGCNVEVTINKTRQRAKWTTATAALSAGQKEGLDQTLWGNSYNLFYGFGRVNARAAVNEALRLKNQ